MTDGPVVFSQVKPVAKTRLLFVQSTATECFITEGNNLGIFEWLQHVNIGYFMYYSHAIVLALYKRMQAH